MTLLGYQAVSWARACAISSYRSADRSSSSSCSLVISVNAEQPARVLVAAVREELYEIAPDSTSDVSRSSIASQLASWPL